MVRGLGWVCLGLGLGASESFIADCRQGIRGDRLPVATDTLPINNYQHELLSILCKTRTLLSVRIMGGVVVDDVGADWVVIVTCRRPRDLSQTGNAGRYSHVGWHPGPRCRQINTVAHSLPRHWESNNDNNNNHDTIYNAVTRRQPYAKVHCGSSGPKSVSAKWPPTRRPTCNLDL